MQPAEAPFASYWWGTSLTNAGLGDVRPDIGTYGRYDFHRLPPLPFELRGDFGWLAAAPSHDQHIGDEKADDILPALASLRESAGRVGLRLPETFTTFLATPALHARIRSNTDCFLDVCWEPVRAPLGDGYLVRFLADSQGCIFWYLYLTADGVDHAVVSSQDFYGAEDEQWQDEERDPNDIVFSAESFETFLGRFWLENEVWFAAWKQTPIPKQGR